MATEETIAKMLRLWMANWPNREIEPATGRLYLAALADVDDATLERAAIECLKSCTFWPTVAELRSKCEIRRGLSVKEAEAAVLAEHPEWADPLTASRAWLDAKRREREWRRAQVRPMLEVGA